MSETLLYGPDGAPLVGASGQKYPSLPLGTYFWNAGLSYREAIQADAEVKRRAKAILGAHLKDLEIRDPDSARRYATDHNMQHELNQQVIAAALLEMGFNSAELREIEKGTGLKLQSESKQPARATIRGIDGREETFIVERTNERTLSGLGVRLHSETTGITWH